jgi:hypothetical protein
VGDFESLSEGLNEGFLETNRKFCEVSQSSLPSPTRTHTIPNLKSSAVNSNVDFVHFTIWVPTQVAENKESDAGTCALVCLIKGRSIVVANAGENLDNTEL